MKRVLIISNMYPSKRSSTYGIFVKNQVEQLRKKGLIVEVAAIKDPRRGKFHTIKKHIVWFMKILYFFTIRGKKYDVVHAHYIFPSGWAALLFKKFFKARIVITSHGGDIDQMPQKSKRIFRKTKRILQASDQVLAVGEQLKVDMINKFGISEGKITVLNMGVDRGIFSPRNKEELKQKLQLRKQTNHILFVGNIIEAKGIIDLLDAYNLLRKKVNNIELHIIGSIANEEFKRFIDEKILSENIPKVSFYKPKEQTELAKWMSAVDVFVLPSHIEGFGLVALEAMSSHTPVVATKVGGLQYLLRDGAGILVEKQNAKSLAKGIEQVLFDEEKRQQLIEAGEKKATQYDQEIILSKLLKIYDFHNER